MLTEQQKKIIKELQKDLPLEERPFEIIAQRLKMTEENLLQQINYLKDKGYMRRFGAALRHREMGITANAMITWKVPEEDCERVGKIIASHPEVTHCYQRKLLPQWEYNLFAMVHHSTKEECYKSAKNISEKIGNYPYSLLFSSEELKKTSMKYFTE